MVGDEFGCLGHHVLYAPYQYCLVRFRQGCRLTRAMSVLYCTTLITSMLTPHLLPPRDLRQPRRRPVRCRRHQLLLLHAMRPLALPLVRHAHVAAGVRGQHSPVPKAAVRRPQHGAGRRAPEGGRSRWVGSMPCMRATQLGSPAQADTGTPVELYGTRGPPLGGAVPVRVAVHACRSTVVLV